MNFCMLLTNPDLSVFCAPIDYRVLHLYTGGSQEVIQTEGPQGSFLPLVDFVSSLICRLSDRYIYI